MGVLIAGFTGTSINPFSTHYWQPEAVVKPDPVVGSTQCTIQAGALVPPRPPLQPRTSNTGPERSLVGAAEGLKGPINSIDSVSGAKRPKKQELKPLSKEDLDEFKDAVVGSTLGKVDLLKGLKSR
jgi:chromatin assembly factor 1 subunit A